MFGWWRAGVVLGVLLSGTACAGGGGDECRVVASRENAVSRDAVGPVQRDGRLGEVRLYAMDGCDSVGSGAWIEAEIGDKVSEEEISAVFESHGWRANPYEVPDCRPGRCDVDLAKKDGSHLVGIRFGRHAEGVRWLEVVSL